MRNHSIVCIMSLLLGSCVSFNLGSGKVTSAKDVQWREPSSPFEEIDSDHSDKAWISKNTGNTISYVSECGNNSEPGLQQMESEAMSAINNLTVLRSDETTFNGRAARMSVAQGTLDGVPVKMAFLVFKKNNCSYTLSYGGVEKQFSTEENYFEDFKNGFKAP